MVTLVINCIAGGGRNEIQASEKKLWLDTEKESNNVMNDSERK